MLKRALVLTAAALAAGGCGPRSGGHADAASRSNPASVRLAYFPNVTHGVALVGTGKGFFAKALGSTKVEEQTFNAGPAEIEALFAGQVDIGYIGPGPAVNGYLKSKGKALQIVAGASSGGAALVARADTGILSVRDLAGKRVASPQTGGTQDISLRHAMQQAGLESTDRGGNVSVLPTANPDTLTLFQKKDLDAAWVPEPWVSRLVKEGGGKVVVDERDLWPGRKFATTVVIVRSEFAQAHPDLVSRLLAAHRDTVDWVSAHRDEAAGIIGSRIKQLTGKALPPDVLTAALSRTDFTSDPLRESVLTFADWSKDLRFQRAGREALAGLFDRSAQQSAQVKPAVNQQAR